MRHVIVTQSRGDASRLAEWVTYHSRLGFDEFHVVLDGLVDNSDEVLRSLDVDASVSFEVKPEQGEYYDDMTSGERWRRILQWREENAQMLEQLPFRATDAQSVRQGLHIGPLIEKVTEGRKGWLAFIDADEFIHVPGSQDIREITRNATAPRLGILNHNVSTEGHDPSLPVLEQHSLRWDRADVDQYPVRGWARRVKTLARFRAATPYRSIHLISRGRRAVVDPEVARIHHFRIPMQELHPNPPLAYTVDDPISMPPVRSEPSPLRS